MSGVLMSGVFYCKFVFAIVFLLGSAPIFYVIWMILRLATLFMSRAVYERGDEFLYSLYQKMVLFFCENLSDLKMIFYGDLEDLTKKKENVILMSNHQCTVDWMVADMLADRQGSIGCIRYILKDSLKYLPLYGSYFRQHSCIYVKRSGKFQKDQAEMQLEQLAANKTPFWMVVFPEGTRYRPDLPSVIAKSKTFAEEHGLPVFEHLLTPRSKALHLSFRQLKKNMDAVYDITVAYTDTISVRDGKVTRLDAPTLTSFIMGYGKCMHIHFKRLSIDLIPEDPEKFDVWLQERFKEKENLLKRFYSDDPSERGTFGSGGKRNQIPLVQTLPAFLFFFFVNLPFWSNIPGLVVYFFMVVFCSFVSVIWAIFQA